MASSDAASTSNTILAKRYETQDFWDRNAPWIIRGSIIGLGVTGVVMITRSMRLFTKFHHARDVPDDFIRRAVRLRGVVGGVTEDGGLLISHRPSVSLKWFTSSSQKRDGLLQVRLAAINIGEAGTDWLQDNFGGVRHPAKQVQVVLIRRTIDTPDAIDGELLTKLHERRFLPDRRVSVNQELVRRGYARVRSLEDPEHYRSVQEITPYSRLVSKLLLSEQVADKRGVGMWRRDDTWVEQVQAFPSQAHDMVVHSTAYRSALLLAAGVNRLAITTWHAAGTTYQFLSWLLNASYNRGLDVYHLFKKIASYLPKKKQP